MSNAFYRSTNFPHPMHPSSRACLILSVRFIKACAVLGVFSIMCSIQGNTYNNAFVEALSAGNVFQPMLSFWTIFSVWICWTKFLHLTYLSRVFIQENQKTTWFKPGSAFPNFLQRQHTTFPQTLLKYIVIWTCSLETNTYVANTKTIKNILLGKLLTLSFSVKFHIAMCYNTSGETASKNTFYF